ncbi:MAG: Hydroxyacylglutathione hydrolase [Rhodocyclaceae bacterium]|nr:Hydroxyacylglutathione hydrolase [Rhodocyclaceae bacterium]
MTIEHGVPVRLTARVRRITAPNPGVMTGPGTNTYLVGEHECAVIDPGPVIDSHVDAILSAAAGKLRWILGTHTHPDHSPAAARLAKETGAEILGRPAPAAGTQDQTFSPTRVLADGERLAGPGFVLRAIATPGHASNHLCYLLEDEKLLFTGDHVMQGSTVVISPPDGDMVRYLASLERLLTEDLDQLAPGHGELIPAPHDMVRALIKHRLMREAKVAAALSAIGSGTLDDLVPRAYDDTRPALYPAAKRSLHAHLIKLAHDGRAREQAGVWHSL